MEYLYHRMPVGMKGEILFPLNILKERYPALYAEHAKKYEGREEILRTEIPTLGCLWNDVLHFTALAPAELQKNLRAAGFDYPPMSWFKVPADMLRGELSTVYLYTSGSTEPGAEEYEPFDIARMELYRVVPAETVAYYKAMKAEGKQPLLFHRVPHILHKGAIDVTGLEVVTA